MKNFLFLLIVLIIGCTEKEDLHSKDFSWEIEEQLVLTLYSTEYEILVPIQVEVRRNPVTENNPMYYYISVYDLSREIVLDSCSSDEINYLYQKIPDALKELPTKTLETYKNKFLIKIIKMQKSDNN